jgi:nicotinamide phosphoribosyltransferase
MTSKNILFATDGYKPSHFLQDPPGTRGKFGYIVARKSDVLWVGLQTIIQDYLLTPVTAEMVEEAADFYLPYGVPFNKEGWMAIVNEFGGFVPVTIKALSEGTWVPRGVALATVETPDDPRFAWVMGWLETLLLRVWYPTTVATRSFYSKITLMDWLGITADNANGLPFKLHDFGARGVSSGESAALGGLAHLVNFMGSDTIEGVIAAKRYYDAGIAGFSIPAAEHSTITAWGRDREVDAFRNMLTQFARPGAAVAVVSDSYDIYGACDKLWGQDLRQQVIDSGATVVIRPDSGDPLEVLPTVATILADRFGYTTNSKGFRVLNNVRIIQGDGIDNHESIYAICNKLAETGFSTDNIAFGMGGGLLQKLDRDTHGFAMKCSAVNIDGRWVDAYKDPITDPGKTSLRGRLTTVRERGQLLTLRQDDRSWSDYGRTDALQEVYKVGQQLNRITFDQLRENAHQAALSMFSTAE